MARQSIRPPQGRGWTGTIRMTVGDLRLKEVNVSMEGVHGSCFLGIIHDLPDSSFTEA